MKHTKNLLATGLIAIAMTSLIFTGCKKEQDTTESDTQSESDNALAESTFSDMHSISDEAYGGGMSSFKTESTGGILAMCAKIAFNNKNSSDPDSISVDFGPTNCLCKDGRNRRGKIIVSYTRHYIDSGAFIAISTDNYFVDDNKIDGIKSIKNNGRNAAGNLSWTLTVDGTITKANGGGVISWKATRTREWIAGDLTPFFWYDDVYLITGSASGTNINGKTFSSNISKPLRREMKCRWIVSGTHEFTPSGKPTRVLDYGNGTCDNDASVTVNGKVYNIKLP
jgi:hypothetical protein